MPRTGTEEIKHDDSRSTVFFCNECGGNPCILSFDTLDDTLFPDLCVIGGTNCNWRELKLKESQAKARYNE